jgi:hypothetical protein
VAQAMLRKLLAENRLLFPGSVNVVRFQSDDFACFAKGLAQEYG